MSDTFYAEPMTLNRASGDVRAAFIRRAYAHLAGAVVVFMLVIYFLMQTTLPVTMLNFI